MPFCILYLCRQPRAEQLVRRTAILNLCGMVPQESKWQSTMMNGYAAPARTANDCRTCEPRPVRGPVDHAALGQLAIKRFPKVLAELAK